MRKFNPAKFDLGPPVVGRTDASQDLPAAWKWRGFGRTPEPEFQFSSVLIEGEKVGVSWTARGWAGSRAAYICPVCQKRSRYLYRLQNDRFGCNAHVPKSRVRLEGILFKLRRAERKQRNGKHWAAGRRLQWDAEDELWRLWDFEGLADWARRETERAKRTPADAELSRSGAGL